MSTVSFRGIHKVYPDGTRAVEDLNLDVRKGELLVLLGPSGCGKTTVLRMLAGLESPTRGEIFVGDRRVDELPAAQRDVAMIFQSYALYPHKTVRQNLTFPLKMRRTPGPERERRVQEVAALLDLTSMLDKRPGLLSGGEQQRVAIGRALVREPAAFLMDEPLSNLDAQLRTRIRSQLAMLQRRLAITTLFVTHDQTEAMTLGHRVAVLHEGRLQQVGPPEELYRLPANVFVAGFIGQPAMNLVAARIEDADGQPKLCLPGCEATLPCPDTLTVQGLGDTQHLSVGWRPEALRLCDPEDREAMFTGTVRVIESLGPERLVHVETALSSRAGSAETQHAPPLVVRISSADQPPRVDERVGLIGRPGDTHIFASDGRSLAPPPANEDGQGVNRAPKA